MPMPLSTTPVLSTTHLNAIISTLPSPPCSSTATVSIHLLRIPTTTQYPTSLSLPTQWITIETFTPTSPIQSNDQT